jgi:Zn-dependent M28 family amino/carboxypeptidase
MHRSKILTAILLVPTLTAADFSGKSAFDYTGKAVAFGARPPNSAAIRKLEAYIRAEAARLGWQLIPDPFTATTPLGPMKMSNIIARRRGTSGRIIVISGHYDTKIMPGILFVGANDGGSSTGLLLELARSLAGAPRKDDVYLVWFDGEEAIGQWSATDGLHGSRHLAQRWSKDGTAARIRALINVDMIGDRDLQIVRESGSAASLQRQVWMTASALGFGKHFLDIPSWIEDDHAPFVRLGVNAIDLIDFDYGPNHSWWHTEQDTMDKLNPRSFEIVGRVVSETIRQLEK